MNSDNNDSDVEIDDFSEEENVEEDVVYSVNSFGADFLVDGLIRRLGEGDIYRPTFQRKFVWTVPQASRFIESILLGLPIPGIFLYRDDVSRKHLIIDGLQRLKTIEAYNVGLFPETNKYFKLNGLSSRFNDLSINDLKAEDKRRFLDTAIHATVIQQLSPEKDSSSAYYIFERLNTGGTPLQPEEIRAALYHGKFQDFIIQLNANKLWRNVFGPEHKRAKDQELILRFFAFRFARTTYASPMKSFLNKFMGANRNLQKYPAADLERAFTEALTFVTDAVGERPFRPVRALNAAAFDAIMVIVSENILNLRKRPKAFAEKYNALMKDNQFLHLITRSTAGEQSVKERFLLTEKFLRN